MQAVRLSFFNLLSLLLLTSPYNMIFFLFFDVWTPQMGVYCYQALSCFGQNVSLGSLNFVFRRNPISFVITHTAVIFEFVNIFFDYSLC